MSSSNRYSDEACQQIKLDGEPCRSAALRGKKFCYYHLHSGPPPAEVSNRLVIPLVQFHVPFLDDATSIQATISVVCEHLLHRRLEPKKAGILLYALQVASSNLSHVNEDRSQKKMEKVIRRMLFRRPLPAQHHQILLKLTRTIPPRRRQTTLIVCRPERFRPLRGRSGARITLHVSDGCMRKMG